MALHLVTAPSATDPVVTRAEAKLHCRVDMADDDALIDTLIGAATRLAEDFTRRAFVTQTWDLKYDAFPDGDDDTIWLPKPPVSSITSIKYVDTAGTTQTWAASKYLTDLPSGPTARRARITPDYTITYPSTRAIMDAVTIRFVCGYGAASTVPDAIKAALKLLVGHWYAYRETALVDSLTPIPNGAEALLWPFRAF